MKVIKEKNDIELKGKTKKIKCPYRTKEYLSGKYLMTCDHNCDENCE